MSPERIAISVVIPVYKAELCLSDLYTRLTQSLSTVFSNFEIILVDDRSPDQSWSMIQKLSAKDPKVLGIRLSRNFGQHSAITAGLDRASGDWIVVMDCDLQDRPEEIGALYKRASEGFDIVLAQRIDRKDSAFKKQLSKLFYGILSYLTETHQDPTIANFGIYNKKAIEVVRSMRESIRYFPVMIRWIGFKTTTLKVEHAAREKGESNYNFRKSMKLALDVMIAFSDKPLRLAVKCGLSLSIISLIGAVYIIIMSLLGKITVIGWPTMVVSLWFFSGFIIFVLGFIGLYVGKIFEQVKGRPIYIVAEEALNSL